MSSSTPPPERDRDRRSLKDLAKLAASPSLTPGPPSSKGSVAPLPFGTPGDSGDSGIVDLKKMTEPNPGVLARPRATPPPPPPIASTRPAPAIAPPPLPLLPAPPVARGRLADEPLPFARKKRGGLAWTVGIGATLAAAAAAFLVLRSQPAPLIAETPLAPPPAAIVPPTPPSDPAASASAPPSPASPPPPEAVAKVDTPAAESPGAANPKVSVASPASPKKSVGVAGKVAAAPPNPALVARNIPASAPQSGSLSDALRQAAGPMDTPVAGTGPSAPAAPVDTGSNVPQKPSQGAIASAVGSSLTQARACLSSDNPISHANITFDSSGSVTNVLITGFAAGKPAEGCIKAALRRAKVPPFAQPTYTTGVTVRPTG